MELFGNTPVCIFLNILVYFIIYLTLVMAKLTEEQKLLRKKKKNKLKLKRFECKNFPCTSKFRKSYSLHRHHRQNCKYVPKNIIIEITENISYSELVTSLELDSFEWLDDLQQYLF